MQLLHSPSLSANIILCYGRALYHIYTLCVQCRSTENSTGDVHAHRRRRVSPPLDTVRAQRACMLRVPGNDRSSHTPGIRPDRMREMHRQRERERDWRTSATTVVTFMTYEKHFEELRRLHGRAGRTNDESSTRSSAAYYVDQFISL